MQKSQIEIAHEMGKDPAWVSRGIKRIKADFATDYAMPNENGIIRENLARWESLYADALRIASVSEGFAHISALRLCAELARQKAEYEVTVGWVANRRGDPSGARGPTMEELRGEISREDLEAIFVTVGDSIKRRNMKEAKAKEIPALPEPATNGQD